MPTPRLLKADFHPEKFYHIVCKSIDGLDLFSKSEDFNVYKNRFKKFTGDFFDVWAYCLLKNHTHYIIQIKSLKDIINFIKQLPAENITTSMGNFYVDNEILFDAMIERQMNSFLVSYANYYNNCHHRKGGIFQKPFKRIAIEDDGHLQMAIIYTNANAQKHRLTVNYKNYPYSSYNSVIEEDDYYVACKPVVAFFGSKKDYTQTHDRQVDYFYRNHWPSSKLE